MSKTRRCIEITAFRRRTVITTGKQSDAKSGAPDCQSSETPVSDIDSIVTEGADSNAEVVRLLKQIATSLAAQSAGSDEDPE